METIKQVFLENQVKELNRLSGFVNAKYSTVGAYTLDGAYSGWELQQYVNEQGGVTVISKGGHVSKRELYNQLGAIIEYVRTKELKHGLSVTV